jgi:hypothetical protein
MGIRAPHTLSSMLVDEREGSARSSWDGRSGRMDHRGLHTTVKIDRRTATSFDQSGVHRRGRTATSGKDERLCSEVCRQSS